MTADEIIKFAALLTAASGIIGVFWTLFKFVERQKKQDQELANMKQEQQMLCYGIAACLDGLTQLGANSNVTKAKEKFEKYINEAAHRNDF